MKKMSLVLLALGLTVALFSIANAGYGNGPRGGCGDCLQQPKANSAEVRAFMADSMDLRQEMMTKRFELQRENLKATPDAAKVASLQAEIKAIQGKVMEMHGKSGLPDCQGDGGCGRRCGGADRNCMGDLGKGTADCNGAPCPVQR